MQEIYIEKGGQKLRCGFTTGSCAAAAAKAAVYMLLTGEQVHEVKIVTPGGIVYRPEIVSVSRKTRDAGSISALKAHTSEADKMKVVSDIVSCAVRKDGGDDPDVTTGMLVYASVCAATFDKAEAGTDPASSSEAAIPVIIEGGQGVGRVTKPGLDQPVGAAAINHVPREMIERSVREVLREHSVRGLLRECGGVRPVGESGIGQDERGGDADAIIDVDSDSFRNSAIVVIISIPGGEERAARTFNPRLGIVGGLSVLGTTGIVEPMSDRALVQTIRTEISMHRAQGDEILLLAPGNYGLSFLEEKYGLPQSASVMISNFAADSVEMAADAGFRRILLTGHIGKLIKIAGGIRNTHSRYGDHRMEILAAFAKEYCPPGEYPELREKLMQCVMTPEAVRILREKGIADRVLKDVAESVARYLEKWSGGRVRAEVIIFGGRQQELVRTAGALEDIERILKKPRYAF